FRCLQLIPNRLLREFSAGGGFTSDRTQSVQTLLPKGPRIRYRDSTPGRAAQPASCLPFPYTPMPMLEAKSQPRTGLPRVVSVDALRGLVITLMVFVNDLGETPQAPILLKHVKIDADSMRLPDLVFPAFLFIAGMSVPLAMGRALAAGQTRMQLLRKVLLRVGTLLTMGVIMVNMEQYEPWARALWG